MKIHWVSRHPALKSQIKELKRLFGEIEIIHDPKPFSNAQEIYNRFKEYQADEIVIVAPMSVISKIIELGIKPLWAEMEEVPVKQSEVVAKGRGYKFKKFKRIKKLKFEFEELQ